MISKFSLFFFLEKKETKIQEKPEPSGRFFWPTRHTTKRNSQGGKYHSDIKLFFLLQGEMSHLQN
jgi:hypothetical protein